MIKKDVYIFCFYMANNNKSIDLQAFDDLCELLNMPNDLEKARVINDFLELMKNETEIPTKCVGCEQSTNDDCIWYHDTARPCGHWNGNIKGVD